MLKYCYKMGIASFFLDVVVITFLYPTPPFIHIFLVTKVHVTNIYYNWPKDDPF